MKRVAALLMIALLLAVVAEARILVVMPSESPLNDEYEDRTQSKKVMQSMISNIMDRWGKPYDIVPPGVAKTEFCRTGVVTHLFGSSGAYTTSYDAVIHCDWKNGVYSGGGYAPDSLTLSGKTLLVPQLFVTINADFTTSATCSLGQNNVVPDQADGLASLTRFLNGTDLRYRAANDEGEVLTTGAVPSGGLRIIIGSRRNISVVNTSMATNCVDCDSLLGPQGFNGVKDTASVWSILKPHLAGSKSLVCVSAGHFWGKQFDGIALLAALAHLDSLTSGGVFDAAKLPIKIGIQVRGGWRRNASHIDGGILAADSVSLKACMDSMRTLRVPFAVGVNMDSLNNYTSDRSWWELAAPYVRYTPEQPPGATASAASNRLLTTFAQVDSAFGRRTDHVLISPGFDWIPSNMTRDDMSKADSMVSYLADAGVQGVVTNSWWSGSRPDENNQTTLSPMASRHYIRYGRSAGSYLPNLTNAGYADSGSARWCNSPSISVPHMLMYLDSFWRSLLVGSGGRPYGADIWNTNNNDSLGYAMPGNARIYTLHASSFGSGLRSDNVSRPTIPGWWQAKYLVNGAAIINKLANRTIIKVCYPEEVAAQATSSR